MMTLQEFAHGQFKRLRGARARKALAKTLSLHHAHTERSLLLLERITRCGSWYRTEWSPHGQSHRQFHCKHPLCEECGRTLLVTEAHRQWDRIKELQPNPEEVSYLTIILPGMSFRGDFKAAAEGLKRRVRYRLGLLGVKYAAQFQVCRNKDGSAKLHTHGIAHHPGRDRKEIQDYLRDKLGYGDRSVYLEEVKVRDGSLDTDSLKGLRYASLTGLKKTSTVDELMDLIHAYEQLICHVRVPRRSGERVLRTRGRVGLRFEVGLK